MNISISEWLELPEYKPNLLSELVGNLSRTLKYWITIIRAPFLTATIAPILLGSAIAYNEFGTFDWSIFWLVFVGALFAHIGTNVINDYFDHTSRNDEMNKLFSPFNGGSRGIQSGLITPANTLLFSLFSFAITIFIGLELNNRVFGDYFAMSILMYLGLVGVFLGIMYTIWAKAVNKYENKQENKRQSS